MSKKKSLSNEQKLINALKTLPDVIEDKKHRIMMRFVDEGARSNESRFEHISLKRHELKASDIKRIVKEISNSEMKIDTERKETYNFYIKRNSYNNEYIKISVNLDFKKSNEARVKTFFITKNLK